VSVALFLLGAAVVLAGPSETRLQEAARNVTRAAQQRGASESETRQAVTVLRSLVDGGVPVGHALQVVTAALSGKRTGPEIAAIARGVEDAHRRGASSHELVNLTEDLTKSGVDAPGLLTALDAVGRLAEEGYTDAETRRGVAQTALQNLRDRERGRDLAEVIREETRDEKDETEAGGKPGHVGSSGRGHGRSDDGKDKDKGGEIRDELRRNPPKGAPEDRGPGRDHGPDSDKGKPDKDKPDKPDNPGGGPKK
jgi:hypothetical protein